MAFCHGPAPPPCGTRRSGGLREWRPRSPRATRATIPAIRDWLTAHPPVVVHFTPTSSSWLNLVERWFAELTNKKPRRITATPCVSSTPTSAPGSRPATTTPTPTSEQKRRPNPRLHRRPPQPNYRITTRGAAHQLRLVGRQAAVHSRSSFQLVLGLDRPHAAVVETKVVPRLEACDALHLPKLRLDQIEQVLTVGAGDLDVHLKASASDRDVDDGRELGQARAAIASTLNPGRVAIPISVTVSNPSAIGEVIAITRSAPASIILRTRWRTWLSEICRPRAIVW